MLRRRIRTQPSSFSGTLRALADGRSVALLTFLPRPTIATFKMPAEELETTSSSSVDDACLFRVQPQSGLLHPGAHLGQSLLGFGFAATHEDEVVRVAHHLASAFLLIRW